MKSSNRTLLLALTVALAAAACTEQTSDPLSPQFAKNASSTVAFAGQGLIDDGFNGFALRTELCGLGNGAEADGPYLLWVFTATGATGASITGPWGTAAMSKTGNGTFKFVSGWYPPGSLTGAVSANASGQVKNPQLVISHGCRPYTSVGAWCSPGFWHNAQDGAWALTGHSKAEFFNSTVLPFNLDNSIAPLGANPDLITVVTNASSNSGNVGKGIYTFSDGNPVELNAFNAVGAMLTDELEGFHFDNDVKNSGSSEACPIDHFGNLK